MATQHNNLSNELLILLCVFSNHACITELSINSLCQLWLENFSTTSCQDEPRENLINWIIFWTTKCFSCSGICSYFLFICIYLLCIYQLYWFWLTTTVTSDFCNFFNFSMLLLCNWYYRYSLKDILINMIRCNRHMIVF